MMGKEQELLALLAAAEKWLMTSRLPGHEVAAINTATAIRDAREIIARRSSSDEQAEVVAWRGKYRADEKWKYFDHPFDGFDPDKYQLEPLFASPSEVIRALTAALAVGDEGMGDGSERLSLLVEELAEREKPGRPKLMLMIAARAVRRGRLLTASEQMENVARFVAEGEDEEEPDACPICAVAFKPDDLCQTDIELGACHSTCLEGSPLVDLQTGDPLPAGSTWPTPYRYDSLLPTPIQGDGK